MKICTVCKEEKGYTQFYKSSREKDGYGYRCKTCDNKARMRSRNRNIPPKENKTKIGYRDRWLRSKYGITLQEYDTKLKQQKYCCAICLTTSPAGEGIRKTRELSFAVDHDHDTGQVRGLLCNLCNRALGFFQDSGEIVYTAYSYLSKYKGEQNDSSSTKE